MTRDLTVRVAVSSTSYAFDGLFTYSVPLSMVREAAPGKRVIVPFGRSSAERIGMIFKVCDGEEPESSRDIRLKKLISIIDKEAVMSGDLLQLAVWLSENTFCTYYDAVTAILPGGMNIKLERHYSLVMGDETLTTAEKELADFLSQPGTDTDKEAAAALKDKGRRKAARSLMKKDVLRLECRLKQQTGEKYQKMARLTAGYMNEPSAFRLTEKQKSLVAFLEGGVSCALTEACYKCGVTVSVAETLCKKGVLETFEKRVMRDIAASEKREDIESLVLTKEQQRAVDAVLPYIREGNKPKCFLLHGITGSGKTSCFKKLISETLKCGRQVMLLLPEIALTPQMVSQFCSLFGEGVTVIHSGLSQGQRVDAFHRVSKGEARIIIGTRSAVFAPVRDLGLIIMDEEGERTYKSESSPRYNTVDVAKFRIRQQGAVLLLASATPSIESYYLAKRGVYELLELKERYGGALLPQVQIADLREEALYSLDMSLSDRLVREININLENREQTILLLNRRGYNSMLFCDSCRQPVFCPNCSVPMTYHKKNHRLICHYCGEMVPLPNSCPACGKDKLRLTGTGTQKIEEEMGRLFPRARVLRMDADAVFSRESYEENIKAFERGDYDILVGTQMVGKGLNFPDCTLVGVLSVDGALYSGDFRAYERTFSLITQVVGRGGRGSKPGRAILQTMMPEHYIIRLAAAQDYRSFYEKEIASRRLLVYPPLCDMCIIGLVGEEEDAVFEAAKLLKAYAEERAGALDRKKVPVQVIGPGSFVYTKVNNKYRYRIIIKCKNTAPLREYIRDILVQGTKRREFSKITVYADMNGSID